MNGDSKKNRIENATKQWSNAFVPVANLKKNLSDLFLLVSYIRENVCPGTNPGQTSASTYESLVLTSELK